ncbi:succinate dehydrogenase, cytochrome b556 subunit [Variovorax sp. RCC_210]|uniref:succinate dehydrogenase, cytochrome b556 subunit n=1 Tax=Variovorax sp. RCC_210 TaxID=3239217 RepID=UPI0035269F19
METGTARAMPERRTPTDPGGARPVFLGPLNVHLPVTATVSLGHRIPGLILVLALPLLILALAASLGPAVDRGGWLPLLKSIGGRICRLVLVWSLAHHTTAGVRHLLFDAGVRTS